MAEKYSYQRLVLASEFEGVLEKPETLTAPIHQSPEAATQLRRALDPGWQIFIDNEDEEVAFAFPLPVDRKQFILAQHLKRFFNQTRYAELESVARPSPIEGESMFSWLSLATTWPIDTALVTALNASSDKIVDAFKTEFEEYHHYSSRPLK